MQVRFTPLLSPYQKSVERRTPPDANGLSMSRVRGVAQSDGRSIALGHAEVIGTPTFSQSLTRDARIDRINGFLAQDSVRSKMIGLGVDPRDAQTRVAALTDSELQLLDQQIASAPAGGDALVIVGIVFLVLLILELTGVINIFR